jgi:FlaA1/EpsC-like NDP-sugar epimerase
MRVGILGGTGSLGQALTEALLGDMHSVSIFSRCELKQMEMKKRLTHPWLYFTLGDIRERKSVQRFIHRGHFDAVYHVAALKHVDLLERNPEESVFTNILGTIYVADACEEARVPLCVFSSTDKAVDPINVYGMSKGISERILFRRNELQEHTKFSVFRWGNVLGSRGSAIPKFIQMIQSGERLELTDPEMTRFWIPLESAIHFILERQSIASRTEAEIPPMKSASLLEIVSALSEILGKHGTPVRVIGNRGGEKKHEQIRSQHSPEPLDSQKCEQYSKKELISLLSPICEEFA